MRWIFRTFSYTFIALWVTELVIPGFSVTGTIGDLSTITLGLVALHTFVRPILKIITLPLNMASFGMFSIAINAFLIYTLSLVFPEITIRPWTFPGLSLAWVTLPAFEFGILATYAVVACCISGIILVLDWIR